MHSTHVYAEHVGVEVVWKDACCVPRREEGGEKGKEAMDVGRGGSKCELLLLLQILMSLPIRSRGVESPFDKRKPMSGILLGGSTFFDTSTAC